MFVGAGKELRSVASVVVHDVGSPSMQILFYFLISSLADHLSVSTLSKQAKTTFSQFYSIPRAHLHKHPLKLSPSYKIT